MARPTPRKPARARAGRRPPRLGAALEAPVAAAADPPEAEAPAPEALDAAGQGAPVALAARAPGGVGALAGPAGLEHLGGLEGFEDLNGFDHLERSDGEDVDGASDPAGFEGAPEDRRLIARICDLLRRHTGIEFPAYKPSTIYRRITRRRTMLQVRQLADYVSLLHEDLAEVHALAEDILIHVTGFFRDPPLFEALAERVLPVLLEERRGGPDEPPLRVWVPGCSTGEEVYSIAMVLAEALGEAAPRASFQIFGSDVHGAAIESARSGIYPEAIAGDVSAARLMRFFSKVDGGYQIDKAIREQCIFVRHDVTRDPPFIRLDLISCRNLLIYFSAELQQRVVPRFHFGLRDPGFLLLGRTETIGGFGALFALEDRANKIYRRRPAAAKMAAIFPSAAGPGGPPLARPPRPRDGAASGGELQREADRVLQARYAPPAVVVDDALDIVCTRGRTGPYLELPSGEARLNVLTMAREGLLAPLRSALQRAKQEGVTVRREAAHVDADGLPRAVHIEVSPLQPVRTARERHFLVVFEDVPAPAGRRAGRGGRAGGRLRTRRAQHAERHAVEKLREELDSTKGYLQAVIDDHGSTNKELGAANEELLSSNEELQSANEELETAREELQIANEELITLNDELTARNAALSEANNDLFNVMVSIDVPIVMVGLDRRIRRFTPAAADKMRLLPSDVGRPLADLDTHVQVADLDRWIAHVIDTMEIKEAEIRDGDGRWYQLQIRPYRTADNRIDGAVVALVDIDVPKRALEERELLLAQVRRERGFLEAVVQQLPAGVFIAEAPSGKLILGNRLAESISPLMASSLPEYGLYRGLHPDGRPYRAEDWPLARSLQKGEIVTGEQIVFQRPDGGYATLLVTSAPVRDAHGVIVAAVAAFVDLSPEIEARARLEREQKLLADAGPLLADLLDIDQTLQRTIRLLVPQVADWCIVDLVDGDQALRQAAVAHADPEREKLFRALARALPPDPRLEHGVGHVARTRRPEIYPRVTELGWVAGALSIADPAVLRELGASSYLCVPLVARDQLVGVLSLIRGEAAERYDEQSLRLAEELGRRFAIAIDNARLHATTVEAVRVRNEFFSIAAHELRTPMSALLLQVQNMRFAAEQGGAPDPGQQKRLGMIERQVQRLDQLVNTLLDVSRIAAGRFELDRGEVDLAGLVQEVAARFSDEARRAGCELSVRAAGPVDGWWDRMRLEQVVTNLLTNALKYGARRPIEIGVDADLAVARIAVRDLGIGIAAENLERIFGQFERAVSAHHYTGLGMGLFITRQIVEAHGGTVRAASELGQGSTFTVELPRRSAREEGTP